MKYCLYDFDGTIYDGDSSVDFFIYCLFKKISIISNLPRMLVAIIKYRLRIIDKTQMKKIFFSFLKKIDNIDEFIEEFWKKNDDKIKEFFRKKEHSKDIIISASPYFLLEPIKKKYGVMDLIASDVDKKSGIFKKENCLGQEKVRVFLKKYPKAIIKEMYSDSLKDKPLLDIAETSYMVKKSKIIPYIKNNLSN